MGQIETGVGGGFKWFASQFHIGFFRSSAGFTMVAFRAGACDIRPLVFPSAVTWHDMVDSEQGALFAAILTGVTVAPEYTDAGEFIFMAGRADHIIKPDDGWQGYFLGDGVDKTHAVFHHFCLSLMYKDDSTPYLADAQWLKRAVKH